MYLERIRQELQYAKKTLAIDFITSSGSRTHAACSQEWKASMIPFHHRCYESVMKLFDTRLHRSIKSSTFGLSHTDFLETELGGRIDFFRAPQCLWWRGGCAVFSQETSFDKNQVGSARRRTSRAISIPIPRASGHSRGDDKLLTPHLTSRCELGLFGLPTSQKTPRLMDLSFVALLRRRTRQSPTGKVVRHVPAEKQGEDCEGSDTVGVSQAGEDDVLDTKVIYRRYASLFFVCGVDANDNELITLEIIHRYVEILDRYFGNVCELDLYILDELILGGELQESSKKVVMSVVRVFLVTYTTSSSPMGPLLRNFGRHSAACSFFGSLLLVEPIFVLTKHIRSTRSLHRTSTS
ncbi:AP-1 complex [Salix suchowensis]|nr:AP-1 complex [Salix suchowensis]